MRFRKSSAVAMGAAALTLPLGACAGQVGGQAGLAGAGRDGSEPARSGAGLERFYGQKPAFEPCDPGLPPGVPAVTAECARLRVPLDYRNPKGERAEIALLRVPARGEKPIGSLVLNPGGPGFPGTGHAALTAAAWARSPITERFDLVGFDPRGVGASKPVLDCYTDAERDRGAKLSSIPAGIDDWTRQETRPARRAVRRALRRQAGARARGHPRCRSGHGRAAPCPG
ncbi:alpha/beta fold hydrolase [Actinomadura madurae]|uniref:alpha/beta fold hydrolase n=1 Tax=Actinomadura madurae TaxID=1993 RepID=UPI0020D22648|nr:alpha/beta fold hydrolase [Actinomadura madurae]MCQ0007314.1 alpha/beta fold hydrolase [Actinomadura madurae]MCQ0017382.1 alpha/beta fold hydrolase [Actinomadura madurae]